MDNEISQTASTVDAKESTLMRNQSRISIESSHVEIIEADKTDKLEVVEKKKDKSASSQKTKGNLDGQEKSVSPGLEIEYKDTDATNKKKKASPSKKSKQHVKPTTEIEHVPSETLLPVKVTMPLAPATLERLQIRSEVEINTDDRLFHIRKTDLLEDINLFAEASEFFPFKSVLLNYTGSQILMLYNLEEKTFTIAMSDEAKQELEKSNESIEEEDTAKNINYNYECPTARPWNSLGSETFIDEGQFIPRKKIKMLIKRELKYFGAYVPFSHRNMADSKEAVAECLPSDDQTFTVNRVEIDRAIQAIPVTTDACMQTTWRYPQNASTQYEPRMISTDAAHQLVQSETFKVFLQNIEPLVEQALQQNNIMNVFVDDWANLGHEYDTFTSKSDHQLKDFQSFTDMQYSKNRRITHIDWHPKYSGIVAVSMGERSTFDQRIDDLLKNVTSRSFILIWSFVDPIRPQLMLEAPEDIMTFKFSPSNPQYLAGGCWNGQIILWDLSAYDDIFASKSQNKVKKIKKTTSNSSDKQVPIVRFCALSSIDQSHNKPISDLLWIPKNYEITKTGTLKENLSGECVQLITCSIGHTIVFWDLRTSTGTLITEAAEDVKSLVGSVPSTFKHLDLVWKPHLKMSLTKSLPEFDYSPTKICLYMKQDDVFEEVQDSFSNEDGDINTLFLSSNIFVGTEDGEILYINSEPAKDQDTGKIATKKPYFSHMLHPSEITAIKRNPLLRKLVLCTGGGSFSLWVDGFMHGPILQSGEAEAKISAACWSLSRASVFFIARQDGSIEVWDLLSCTHQPLVSQSVISIPLIAMSITQMGKQHLLAVGDNNGTLHILEIPHGLRVALPNELELTMEYVDREKQRLEIYVNKMSVRKIDPLAFQPLASVKKVKLTTDQTKVIETEEEEKAEYALFLEEQAKFLEGIKEKLRIASQTAGTFNPNYIVDR